MVSQGPHLSVLIVHGIVSLTAVQTAKAKTGAKFQALYCRHREQSMRQTAFTRIKERRAHTGRQSLNEALDTAAHAITLSFGRQDFLFHGGSSCCFQCRQGLLSQLFQHRDLLSQRIKAPVRSGADIHDMGTNYHLTFPQRQLA